MPKAKTTSLVVVNGDAFILDKAKLAKFQVATIEQLSVIDRMEADNVNRRLFVGLALICIKASLKHGEYMPWLKKHVKGSGQRKVNYMMAAARIFIEQSKVARPQLAAFPDGNFSLELKGGALAKLAAAATKFADGQTWGELLDAHGIKETGKIGGARNVTPVTPDAPADPEQLYIGARDEIGSMIEHAETLLVKENRLAHLVGHPDEVRGVVDSLRSLANKVEAAAQPLLTAQPTA